MKWQRLAQIAIAGFVIIFIGVIALSMRRQTATPAQAPPPPRTEGNPQIENPKGGKYVRYQGDKAVLDIKFGNNLVFPDGRTTFSKGVEVTTTRNGREMIVKSEEADVVPASDPSKGLKTAAFRKNVVLTGGGGLQVRSADATYDDTEGIVKIPGAVEFAKGRMKGSGVGATYDRNREVLWILDKAQVTVAPEADGKGAVSATSGTAGLARAEHYLRLTGNARIDASGRLIQGDETTIVLTPDDERMQMLQVRGNSRISGGGPQTMAARDIDLAYAEDGKTLQRAQLMEQAVLQLAGSAGAGTKRIAGKTIELGLGPDGSTITSLSAVENVQVDLPGEASGPAKRIRSAALNATGAPDAGLRQATFSGKVEYREVQAARRNLAAVDRTARSESLIIDTQPGLGAIQKADFHGNVKIVDAPDVTAEAQRGIYYLDRSRIELMPSTGDPGPSPLMNDGKISVSARTINFTLGSRELEADTRVRSTILAKQRGPRGPASAPAAGTTGRVPSMLKDDEPVNVTSNRLAYKGDSATATYTGNVKLWQGTETTIKADTIVLDDKNGNLTATANVSTLMTMDEVDKETGKKQRTETTGKSELFVYNDARRLATYTTKAQIDGPQGHVTATRIELFLKPAGANELDHAEAYGSNAELVIVREELRTATGTHLTYTAADEQYLMVGTPVTMLEDQQDGTCNVGRGSTLQFFRGSVKGQMDDNGISRGNTTNVPGPCSAVKR
ncbi:MAG: LptA/OstA family protein [Vicinamibacterales bacterium]